MLKSRREEYGAIVAKLFIELARTSVELFLQSEGTNDVADAVLCAAIFIGQAEGRPMTASSLSAYIGVPRPTVIRKLNALKARGIVAPSIHKTWVLPVDAEHIAARADASIFAKLQLVRKATAELSRLDNATIARRRSPNIQRPTQ